MNRRAWFLVLALLINSAFSLWAQKTEDPESKPKLRKQPPPIPVEEIVKKFAVKESEFKLARDRYTFRQTIHLQVLELDGRKTGEEYLQVADVLFDDKGRRVERVVKAPVPTLERIMLTPEDLDDFKNMYPFVLTTANVDNYILTYRGMELVDEIDTYVFDVTPKTLEKDQRYFEGKIWVDQQDLQIVKTYGRPSYLVTKKNASYRFARFETYRQQVDGKYWFPVYSRADDVLKFETGDVRVKEVLRYENYKQYIADVKIQVEGELPQDTPPQK
jgi:hypothetical protein